MTATRDPVDRPGVPAARRAPHRGLRAPGRAAAAVREAARPVVRQRHVNVVRRTLAKAWDDRILGLSAEGAFWQLLSLPPLFLALLGSLGYLSGLLGPETVNQIEQQLLDSSPGRSRRASSTRSSPRPSTRCCARGGPR